jgi:ribosomal protein L37E
MKMEAKRSPAGKPPAEQTPTGRPPDINDDELRRCASCSTVAYEEDIYCARCGRVFGPICRRCGAAVFHPIAFYCVRCGEKLEQKE